MEGRNIDVVFCLLCLSNQNWKMRLVAAAISTGRRAGAWIGSASGHRSFSQEQQSPFLPQSSSVQSDTMSHTQLFPLI